MADKTLVQMLRNAGVEAWTRSRVNHPDYPRCDIYEEAIQGADLSRADLSGTDQPFQGGIFSTEYTE